VTAGTGCGEWGHRKVFASGARAAANVSTIFTIAARFFAEQGLPVIILVSPAGRDSVEVSGTGPARDAGATNG